MGSEMCIRDRSSVPPVISTMHRSPAAGGVIKGCRLLSSANRHGQMTGGVITRGGGSGILDSVKRPSPSLSSHSWLSPGSMVSPRMGFVVAGDSGAAAGVSGLVAEVLSASARGFCASPVLVLPLLPWLKPRRRVPVPVPVGGEDPEKNDVILARGAATADTGGVHAVGSIGPL